MKCDHCGVKRFVCLMYNCTDLDICAFCSSDKLSSPNSKVSISKLWRNCRLFAEIRSAPAVSSFKKSLINDVNLLKPSRYYSYGCRVLNVLHTRLRHRSSNLNADHFRINLINDSGCVCGWVIEDAIHFFLEWWIVIFVGVNQQWRKCSQKKIVKFNIWSVITVG
jgi:hypothetical protein